METSTYPIITDEEGKVFYIVPELLTLIDKERRKAATEAVWDAHGYPPGCSACHFNKKERKQPVHQSRARYEHCNTPIGGLVHRFTCGNHQSAFVTPRNLKKYQTRAVVARLTGELK